MFVNSVMEKIGNMSVVDFVGLGAGIRGPELPHRDSEMYSWHEAGHFVCYESFGFVPAEVGRTYCERPAGASAMADMVASVGGVECSRLAGLCSVMSPEDLKVFKDGVRRAGLNDSAELRARVSREAKRIL